MSCFESGRELYIKKDYHGAVSHFKRGVLKELSQSCGMWLGQCYEYGLGVHKDLVLAKDLYSCVYNDLSNAHKASQTGIWLAERLNTLASVPECDRMSMYIDGIGNVKVIKQNQHSSAPRARYNNNELVVVVRKRDSFAEGIAYAEIEMTEINKKWTCDGVSRFYDGYTLETDNFTLKVLRGCDGSYRRHIDGRYLTLHYPADANPDYVYVQETILKKVKDMLFERAKVVLPVKLKEVSDKIGTRFYKCGVKRTLGSALAYNVKKGIRIDFASKCIQLPDESLEALCVHELTHNFVAPHNSYFYRKMKELGGEKIYALEKNLFKERKWPYLRY